MGLVLCNLKLFGRYVCRAGTLNVLLLGESTFHQVHGGTSTSDDTYFTASLPEHAQVTGEDYSFSFSYQFFADLGERYGRLPAVGRYLFEWVSERTGPERPSALS